MAILRYNKCSRGRIIWDAAWLDSRHSPVNKTRRVKKTARTSAWRIPSCRVGVSLSPVTKGRRAGWCTTKPAQFYVRIPSAAAATPNNNQSHSADSDAAGRKYTDYSIKLCSTRMLWNALESKYTAGRKRWASIVTTQICCKKSSCFFLLSNYAKTLLCVITAGQKELNILKGAD